MYTTDHIFPVIPIKDITNEDVNPTMPFKLATGTKPSVSNLCVVFCPCVVQKTTSHVGTKALNMSHQAQKGFRGSLELQSIKKDILCTYQVQGR